MATNAEKNCSSLRVFWTAGRLGTRNCRPTSRATIHRPTGHSAASHPVVNEMSDSSAPYKVAQSGSWPELMLQRSENPESMQRRESPTSRYLLICAANRFELEKIPECLFWIRVRRQLIGKHTCEGNGKEEAHIECSSD